MESSLHFHPLKKDASLCSSTECSQMTPQKCEQLALNSSTKEVKWIVPEKCSNSAGQLWCEKKLNTVRVTKFCSSSTQINEKLDVSRLKDDATDTSKLTSIEELQAINSYKHQSSRRCEWYTTPRCFLLSSWCYPPINWLSQYQCGQQQKHTYTS